jgi:hypothetical protein
MSENNRLKNEIRKRFRKLTLEEMEAMVPPGPPPEKEKEEWFNQIRKLSHLARLWSHDNPNRSPKVQFNWPQGVMLIAPVEIAISEGMITCDEAGHEMLTAMGAFEDTERSPTAFMVRSALEFMEEIAKEEGGKVIRNVCPHCNYKSTMAKGITSNDKPQPGAFSICINCGGLSTFGEDMKLGLPTEEQLNSLKVAGKPWEMIQKAQEHIQQRGRLRGDS